ncbi:MAG: spore maturation protein [bacterium]|nr:spore maturation protein [bacterium]
MINISVIILPIIVLFIVVYGIIKKVNVYDVFIDGSKEGLVMVTSIFGSILAMVVSVNVFLKSGIVDDGVVFIKPFLNYLNIPSEVLPLAIVRPLSGTSALAILSDILKNSGVDTYIGKVACLIQSSTETTIYVIGLYFGSVGIKKIKYALLVGLLTDLFGFILVILLVK